MYAPVWKWRSLWHTPAATVLIKTSCGPGFEIWTSSIESGCFTARSTAAFIVPSTGRAGARAAILEARCAAGSTDGRIV